MMEDAKKKKFQVLLVYKVDRFSRRLKDLIMIFDELKKEGVNFTSVTEQIDTTTAMGEAFFQVIGVFAQLERGMIKERVTLAFDKKVSIGEATSRAPFGYCYKDKRMVPDEENATKVVDIFNLWASGANYKAISEEFGLPVSSLYEIIKNPTYIGKIRYKGKLFKGAHKPLIEEKLFYQINQVENIDDSVENKTVELK
jgi:site-specific DNA recombinase